jgi:hypothetical protein
MVIEIAALPARAEDGFTALTVGCGLAPALMVKLTALDVPPPGEGLETVKVAVPAATMSLAGIVAVRAVELSKVDVSGVPFQLTVEAVIKPEPVSMTVVAAAPAFAELGFALERTGKGFCEVVFEAGTDPEPPQPTITYARHTDTNRNPADLMGTNSSQLVCF